MKLKRSTRFIKAGIFCVSLVLLAFSGKIQAQDIHFTQFYHNPLLLNPAQTGLACNWRMGINYRNQWNSVTTPYKTMAAYFDMPFYFNKKRNSSLGVGMAVYQDKAGDGQLTSTEAIPSVALHLGLGSYNPKRFKLSIGVQPVIRQRAVDQTKLTWEAQYDPSTGQINPLWNPNEVLNNPTFHVFDLNSGFQVSAAPSEAVNFWVGAAVFHILQPNESFYSNSAIKLPMRSVANAGGRFFINDKLAILPNVLFMRQAAAMELNFGAEINYTVNPKAESPLALVVGPYYRWKDAFQLLVGGEYNHYRLGITYDINSSSLRTASHLKGGFELALMYKAPCRIIMPNINKMLVCPRF